MSVQFLTRRESSFKEGNGHSARSVDSGSMYNNSKEREVALEEEVPF